MYTKFNQADNNNQIKGMTELVILYPRQFCSDRREDTIPLLFPIPQMIV